MSIRGFKKPAPARHIEEILDIFSYILSIINQAYVLIQSLFGSQ